MNLKKHSIRYLLKQLIESKVNEILSLKKQHPKTETNHLEQEIDKMVYELYGLTKEEAAIVEGVEKNY